jgi:repressor LexA
MNTSTPHADALKARKLVQLAADLRQGKDFSITRLTMLKSLAGNTDLAHRFALYVAQKTKERMGQDHKTRTSEEHEHLMDQALSAITAWMARPTRAGENRLRVLRDQMRDEQNEHRKVHWASVRIIHDRNLLLFEYALESLLCPEDQNGLRAYQLARHYAERYDSRYGTGLIPASAQFMQDIADFWVKAVPGTDGTALLGRRPKEKAMKKEAQKAKPMFTHRQGQFLAFLHLYRKLHRQSPAELDFAIYFRITPPAVHGMIVKLEKEGLITRTPGVPRSAVLAIREEDIPELEEVAGPAW